MYHAQPRHCLQRISCPDDGQHRAPVHESAGCSVRLNKRPLRLRVFDAGTATVPTRTNTPHEPAGRHVAVGALWTIPSPVPLTGSADSQAALAMRSSYRRSTSRIDIRADRRPRCRVSSKITRWAHIEPTLALRSSQPYAKRLKFQRRKGGRVV